LDTVKTNLMDAIQPVPATDAATRSLIRSELELQLASNV
jgi:hypothetical protein